ncbi:Uncharacterised protein [Salmonella enterica subsp. salamae]|uniref:Uncharacterized protein n=1 Tax=Salmonella enterica TaxID=28901 RepID=A0A379SGI8_SALER|nr:Uncharacterised protein [Salmonella enterica]SUJ09166.1 Uncharacterised protein [Salmonella enterica subsp. salamae]
MRMSLTFAAVTLLTGINLLFIPFQPVPALWGAGLAVAFILMNVVADKLRLWSGVAWIIVAGITPDNCPSTLKPYVSHSYSSVSCFLPIPGFAVGVRSAVMLRTGPAALSLPGPSGSGFPS